MAISLIGNPQRMTPGYNPVYWYTDSDQLTETTLLISNYIIELLK